MKVLIVGAGLTGATIARCYMDKGLPASDIVVIDKRNHIAGNCYDRVDDETGILMNDYGAHLFHTESKVAWDFVNRFATWQRWDHRVLASVDGLLVPVPVNPDTVNALCGAHLRDEADMARWLEENQTKFPEGIANSREMAMSRVGPMLYEKLFEGYTRKQWDRDASELNPSVLARIPVNSDRDGRYFKDRYQGLPVGGYTRCVRAMLGEVDVRLGVDFFDMDRSEFDLVVYTGPIDRYFASSGLDPLEYRSIHFDVVRKSNCGFHQPNSVINHPDPKTPHVRVVEYKHFLNQNSPNTVYVVETPVEASASAEPYYPVQNQRNLDLYDRYKSLAEAESGVHFIGRLASYKYFNMDQAILAAMAYFDQHLKLQ